MTGKDTTPNNDDALFLSAAKDALDQSLDSLDSRTLDRLARIRQQAVLQAANRPAARGKQKNIFPWLLPVSGLATAGAAAIVAFMLWTGQPVTEPPPPAPMAVLEDINILTDSEEIDFYQNLEFYEWLAANEQAVS